MKEPGIVVSLLMVSWPAQNHSKGVKKPSTIIILHLIVIPLRHHSSFSRTGVHPYAKHSTGCEQACTEDHKTICAGPVTLPSYR